MTDGTSMLSEDFRIGYTAGIQKVLNEVETQSQLRAHAGFSETNFTIGVLNSFLIVYVFGAFPQHFWMLYIIEAFILIPMKYKELLEQKPLSGKYFFLDYCWCMNFCGVFALILFSLNITRESEGFHKNLFLASYGAACGPLLGAAFVLPFVSLLFHSFGTMCDLFIHIYPPMLVYTLRWNADEILKAWPNVFDLNYVVNFFPTEETKTTFFGMLGVNTIFGNTIVLYFMWLFPYLYWINKIGMKLPRSNAKGDKTTYDTVFHSIMRKGLCISMGNVLWKRPIEESKRQVATNDFEWRDLYAYLVFHAVGFFASLLILAYPCYKSKTLHGTLLLLLGVVCSWRGAIRYTYYSTEMYVKMVQNVLDEKETSSSKSGLLVDETSPLLGE